MADGPSDWQTIEEELTNFFELLSELSETDKKKYLDCFGKAIGSLEQSLAHGAPVQVKQIQTARLARLESLRFAAENVEYIRGGLQDPAQTRLLEWKDLYSAFHRRIRTGVIPNLTHVDPKSFLDDAKETVVREIDAAIAKHRCVKVNTSFNAKFLLKDNKDVKCFNTLNRQLFSDANLDEWFDVYVRDSILTKVGEFQERDSGWTLHTILNLTVNINRCEPLSGSSFIRLPDFVQRKKAVVNVRADDQACFAWSIVSALYPASTNVHLPSSYPHYTEVLDWSGLTFPMQLKQIVRFEELNSISVNIFIIEGRKIVPLQLTKQIMEKHVNLLLITDGDVSHFTWIKNMSRLVSRQISRHAGKIHVCDRCLHAFYHYEKLVAHKIDCASMNNCALELPQPGNNILKFKNFNRKERAPFVIYADFECLLKNWNHRGDDNDNDMDQDTDSDDEMDLPIPQAYQKHSAFSVGYYVKCSYDSSKSRYVSYRGKDPATWLVKELRSVVEEIEHEYERQLPMNPLDKIEFLNFKTRSNCHICDEPFSSSDVRVRDHCHFTGKYRGPAHNACNLNYQPDKVVPVVFHNLTGYDAHFIIKQLVTLFDGRTTVLPLNKEKYISFSKKIGSFQLRFIDSFRFLDSSLEQLVSYLSPDKLEILQNEFKFLPSEKRSLLFKKGVFPYDWLDSVDKLEAVFLPPKEKFYNKLNNSDISAAEYEHAKNVWREFEIGTMGEYSDLYLKTDVLLLADVFENFRKDCLAHYSLDPAHYYTIPGLAWDAMLRVTSIELELFTDIDMLLFVERGIRGGLSQCSNRYSRANNRYMHDYDSSKPSKYLMYFDVNNLYGWAMSQCLPFQNFTWVSERDFDVNSVADDAAFGYFLEVDLEYPKNLHDRHRDLPFCPTHEKAPDTKDDKLLATVENKYRYVIHYRNLKQCLAHGLRLTKIHRILKFEQKAWLKSYIDLNTKLRADASNDFEKNLFKLMNNAVFGKTMENVRNHVDIRLVNQWEGRYGAKALIAKPAFHRQTVFAENFVAIEMRKLDIKFNKPIYVGMSILDVSKTCVYDFHHDYMLNEFGDRCKLMYTDTDSLLYEIQCDDVYDLLKRDAHKFDTSDYPSNNAYGIPLLNKKIPGLMKDESNGEVLREYIGLRAKMFALLFHHREIKRLKGIKKNIVAREITFADYLECLLTHVTSTRVQRCIRSRKHVVYSMKESKVALSAYDTKRYLIPGSTDTLPWGHYAVPPKE